MRDEITVFLDGTAYSGKLIAVILRSSANDMLCKLYNILTPGPKYLNFNGKKFTASH